MWAKSAWHIEPRAARAPPIEFSDLIAFHADGTVTERFGFGHNLSAGIGVCKKVGRRTFAVTFENFEDRDHDGIFDVRCA